MVPSLSSLVDMLLANSRRVSFLVVPFAPGGLPFLGLFASLDFSPSPLFLFLSLSWVLLFKKVWQGSIICPKEHNHVHVEMVVFLEKWHFLQCKWFELL